MVINLGQLQQNAWFSKKIQHNCKVQGPNPDPTYSYERRAGTEGEERKEEGRKEDRVDNDERKKGRQAR